MGADFVNPAQPISSKSGSKSKNPPPARRWTDRHVILRDRLRSAEW